MLFRQGKYYQTMVPIGTMVPWYVHLHVSVYVPYHGTYQWYMYTGGMYQLVLPYCHIYSYQQQSMSSQYIHSKSDLAHCG
jgi:hypothetical protein